MTNWLQARVVRDCPYHFVLEWEGQFPKDLKVGPYEVKSLGASMLENPKTPLIGFWLRDPQGELAGKRRIIIGTDYDSASVDGTPLPRAPQQTIDALNELVDGVMRQAAESTLTKPRGGQRADLSRR
jgi:hypothetical protein